MRPHHIHVHDAATRRPDRRAAIVRGQLHPQGGHAQRYPVGVVVEHHVADAHGGAAATAAAALLLSLVCAPPRPNIGAGAAEAAAAAAEEVHVNVHCPHHDARADDTRRDHRREPRAADVRGRAGGGRMVSGERGGQRGARSPPLRPVGQQRSGR